MKPSNRVLPLACLLSLFSVLHAEISDTELKAASRAMADAAAERAALADSVVNGSAKPADALAKLKNTDAKAGFSIDGNVGVALAAIDVGQRLAAVRKIPEAIVFFEDAEKSLDGLVKDTADERAGAKASYLQKLALIRGRYLNKPAQAKADIEAAIRLQPDDKSLQKFRARLGNDQAELFAEKPGN